MIYKPLFSCLYNSVLVLSFVGKDYLASYLSKQYFIMALTTKEKSALKHFKAGLKQALGSQLTELKLFGSKARGDDQPDSDIDVLTIIESDDWHIRDTVYDVATDILLQMDVCISPKVISKNRFDRLCKEGTSFIHNVSRDAITV